MKTAVQLHNHIYGKRQQLFDAKLVIFINYSFLEF